MRTSERSTGQALRWRLGGSLIPILLIAATWGLQQWHVSNVRDTISVRQQEARQKAADHIREEFDAVIDRLHARAQELASEPVVQELLARYVEEDLTQAPEQLVEFFREISLRENVAAELYDPKPQLIAWKGSEMPLGEAPNSPLFLQTPQADIVADRNRRYVLAVWWPVAVGQETIGGIRVLQLMRYESPVQNRYLRDYSMAAQWSDATGLAVHVRFEEPDSGQGEADVILRNRQDAPLAYVIISPPPADVLVRATADGYNDIMSFWLLLLLVWLLVGAWSSYRRLYLEKEPNFALMRMGLAGFAGLATLLWALRFVLLELNIPAGWQMPGSTFAPLFDPQHLASTMGYGLMRSIGDLFISSVFAVLFGLALLDLASVFRKQGFQWYKGEATVRRPRGSALWQFPAIAFGLGGVLLAIFAAVTVIARRVVLDSTIDYFARGDLLPEPIVLVIYAALLLVILAAATLAIASAWMGLWMLIRYRPNAWMGAAALLLAGAPMLLAFLLTPLGEMAPWTAGGLFFATVLLLSALSFPRSERPYQLLAMRNVLMGLFLLTLLMYPLLFTGMDMQRRVRMQYAARTFAEGEDPRVVFAINQVLEEVEGRMRDLSTRPLLSQAPSRQDQPPDDSPPTPPPQDESSYVSPQVSPPQDQPAGISPQARLDSTAGALLRGSLLSSLNLYEVSLTFFDSTGAPMGRAQQPMPVMNRQQLNRIESMEFSILRDMFEERPMDGSDADDRFIEQITGRQERERFQYAGLVSLDGMQNATAAAKPGWAMVRAEPQMLLRESRMPFPRVLLPEGIYGILYADLSLAEFSNGLLVRSFGRDFGRYRLDEATQRRLYVQPALWQQDQLGGRAFLTYYERRTQARARSGVDGIRMPSFSAVIAARTSAINTFDHLYYLLRLTVAGLFLALPFYLLGLYMRHRAGLLPAPQVRFRNKVLNAFLAVGILTVTAVGFVGLNVVKEENERATQNWLREQLERIEETLSLEAEGGELPYNALERMRAEMLSLRVGLPINLYSGHRLVASSRNQLVEQRLIDRRLPIDVYRDLYYHGYRFTYAEERVGDFEYMTGFRTLLDESGAPRYVVGVPTLPEQERIKEERARTVAYLFGALLLLMMVVMLTASLIANALARPIARLREGLQAVARGRFERRIPVSTRDEIGELVETFNTTQDQLAESRRRLAQQERQLAWREMARQVAHEIKNPLTPMKLSVQHMRRSWRQMLRSREEQDEEEARFDTLFDRITSTLIEQIDALARIANEFHSFARMPTSAPEMLDVNGVLEQAIALMQEEEGDVEMETDLTDEPLELQADQQELRRLFINLIKNAIQSIPEEREGRVTIRSSRRSRAPQAKGAAGYRRSGEGSAGAGRPRPDPVADSYAHISVSDNGAGIPRELREKIFEPNFSTKTSGTGLGLAIAAKSAEDLQGTIDFETEEDEGTTFNIWLPLG